MIRVNEVNKNWDKSDVRWLKKIQPDEKKMKGNLEYGK